MSNEEDDTIIPGDDPGVDDEAIEALEDLGYGGGNEGQGEDEETTIVPSHKNEAVANHPKIKRILKNRDVSEVRVNWKRVSKQRIRQPYVCIVFRNGSSVERPLSDIEDEESACGPTDIVPHNHGRVEPEERAGRGGGWRRLFRRGGDFSRSEIQRFTDENGCTVVVKRAVIRKCNHRHDRHQHDHDDHQHHRQHDCGCDCHKQKRGWFS